MRLLSIVLAAACTASLAWLHPPRNLVAEGMPAGQSPSPPTSSIDACVTDDNGRAITWLRPQDLRVTVDGEARPVTSLLYVYRGPGADESAALADPARDAPAAAERARTLLLLVDENSIPRGREKPVVGAVARLLDELGSADQAAVASMPAPPGTIQLSTNPAARQAALAHVIGRATADTVADASQPGLRTTGDNPDRAVGARGADPDEQGRLGEAEREALRGKRSGQADAESEAERGMRPQTTARALLAVVEGVRALPGLKTLILFTQTEPPGRVSTATEQQERQETLASLKAAAARSRAVIHLVVVGQADRRRSAGDDGLREVAATSGGTITVVKNADDSRAFDEVRAALWGGYLVEFEGREKDRDGRPHAVKVEAARAKTTVRAPQLWLPRNDPAPKPVSVPPAATTRPGAAAGAAAPAAAPPPGPAPARRPRPEDAQLSILLARMREYLAAFVRDFGNVVAEEDYSQRMVSGEAGQPRTRHLRSDLLLVKTTTEAGWTQYRDVFEVDGKPLRDREERVQKLFLENPSGASRLAQEISNESARYNIGTLTRTINVPTLPLALLGPKRIQGVSFERDGQETVSGVKATRVTFEEMARPTLVRPINVAGDAPASGTLWIDPSNGRILKTRIFVTAGRSEMTTTVVYKPAPETGLWVPAELEETYKKPGEHVEGRATYRNFRSFKVTTDTQIK